MFYTVYKITNTLDNKIYIGKHQTLNLEDNYMGSGKLISRSVKKHGIENFKKEILHIFDNEDGMNAKEAELVNEGFCLREDTYNICPGGKGGWGYVNDGSPAHIERTKRAAAKSSNKPWSDERKAEHSEIIKNLWLQEDYRNKILQSSRTAFKGKIHTKEAKRKIGKASSKHQTGSGNSQFGTCWVYSDIEKRSIKIDKVEIEKYLSLGWKKGRRLKFQ